MKRIPEEYNCHVCGDSVNVVEYLTHLEYYHHINLNHDLCIHGPIYNDKTAWKRTGDSCLQHGLLSIWDDGRFPGFKQINGSDNSADGSADLIKSYPNTMYFEHGVDYEEAKFNFAMHLAAKMGFRYVILLGSDEWIVGDVKELIKVLDQRMKDLPENESQAFQVAIDEHQPENKWNRFITESPKIYANPGLLRTRFTHWLRYSAAQIAREGIDQPLHTFQKRICTIVIHHDDSIREKSRNDLMTSFQDRNVKRERNRIEREAFRHLFEVTFLTSELSKADWHRSFFLDSKDGYTHFLVYDDRIQITRKLVEKIHASLLKAKEAKMNIDVLSAVYKLDKNKSWSITINPPDCKYENQATFDIYHKAKYNPKQKYFGARKALGPIFAISKDTVKEIDTITDVKEFVKQLNLRGFNVFCDSSIQVNPVEELIARPQ